jgi:hypothetical protein
MTTSLWLAVFSIVVSILFGTFSIVVTLIVAVWKVGLRFTTIEKEMVGFREAMTAQNRRLERIESKVDGSNHKPV